MTVVSKTPPKTRGKNCRWQPNPPPLVTTSTNHGPASATPPTADLPLPKIAPRRPKRLPRGPQDGPSGAQEAPKTAQEAPKTAQEKPRSPPGGPNEVPRGSETAPTDPTWLQICLQEGGGGREATGTPQTHQSRFHRAFDISLLGNVVLGSTIHDRGDEGSRERGGGGGGGGGGGRSSSSKQQQLRAAAAAAAGRLGFCVDPSMNVLYKLVEARRVSPSLYYNAAFIARFLVNRWQRIGPLRAAPGGPSGASGRSGRPSGPPRSFRSGPDRAADAPRLPQTAPGRPQTLRRRLQDGSRRPQAAPSGSRKDPHEAKIGPFPSENVYFCQTRVSGRQSVQDGRMSLQDRPNTAPEAPDSGLRGQKSRGGAGGRRG